MASYIERDLFGGAIVAKTERNLLDASDMRQVPDTQEVLLFPNSGISVIIEILQRVEANEDIEAVKFHFNSLVHDNDAESSAVETTAVIPNDRGDRTPSAITLRGEQRVKKFNKTTADSVRIFMGLFRVEDKGIDVVVTFNVPVESADGGAVGQDGLAKADRDFNLFVRSFRIKDFSLFA